METSRQKYKKYICKEVFLFIKKCNQCVKLLRKLKIGEVLSILCCKELAHSCQPLKIKIFNNLVGKNNSVKMVNFMAKAFGKVAFCGQGDFLTVFV